MKRLLFQTLLLCILVGAFYGCHATKPQEKSTGEQMLEMLNEQHLSLLVYNDSTLSTHTNRGVRDLLTLISTQPERLQGAIVADKIIGRAAAAIMATGGVVEVHTNIISTPARALLEAEGIKVVATEEVPQILNRNKSQMCPIDSQLEGIESIEECVTILQNMLITL
jgi:hypothetical protein